MNDNNVIPFNPLHKRHLGESVGQALLRRPPTAMADLTSFSGAGVYAIYYQGEFPAYEAIASMNRQRGCLVPIYVGKAVPKGARKGGDLEANPGKALFNRLTQHRRSIEEATNLNLADFHCRFLVVDDIWIPLGESLLIAKFNPLWNLLIDGFGNHDPGSGRHAGVRPRWDVLHPGRAWAQKCRPREESAEQIVADVKQYLRDNPPTDDAELITP
ncbi:Eco29kI restriction endonuclease [Thiorhodovibrio winogradskyi]|uniref:Eco29kI restriction endonuclease n=1 Tax=Thiorhodovibrio winogradskyi TaxID=77007 RepID=A0ABZ0SE79_9GAMM|nr:Eco29kI family restriction endonuclease [Thiorhodovibrio winogradskyi]